MTAETDRFHQTLKDGVEGELESYTDEIAKSIVATIWNACDDERGRLAEQVRDAERMRDFEHRSAKHIMAKRDLAEAVLAEWESGALEPTTALRMIRSALAVGDVKTRAQLDAEAGGSDGR